MRLFIKEFNKLSESYIDIDIFDNEKIKEQISEKYDMPLEYINLIYDEENSIIKVIYRSIHDIKIPLTIVCVPRNIGKRQHIRKMLKYAYEPRTLDGFTSL